MSAALENFGFENFTSGSDPDVDNGLALIAALSSCMRIAGLFVISYVYLRVY